jgi:excisionase family DNA binding protein
MKADLLEELTDREMQVVKLVAQGLSNKAIANKLHIADGTVKNHLRHIFLKTRTSNRTHFIAYAYQEGLIVKDIQRSKQEVSFPEPVISVREIARWLNIAKNTVRNFAKRGDIPFYRLTPTGHMKFRQSDIDRFLRERKDDGKN